MLFKDKTNLYNMYKIELRKTSKRLWSAHRDMYVVKWIAFFRCFHSPKIHSSIFRKITIDLLSFWGVYDVNLCEKNSGRNLAYKTEAVFPILKQKQSFRGISQKQLFCNVAFLRFSKPGEMPVTEFILVLYLSVLLACYFTKGWTFCQTI